MRNDDDNAQWATPEWFLELKDRVHRQIAAELDPLWHDPALNLKEHRLLFQGIEDEEELASHEKPTELDTKQREIRSKYATKPLPQERAS